MTNDASIDASINRLFVYGTLRRGESRWHHLERFVVDDGTPDAVAGSLFDTGYGYPAAVFGGDGSIIGHVYSLRAETLGEALRHLDEVEGAVRGLYQRIASTTLAGTEAWAYEWGDQVHEATPIASGDWLSLRTD